MRILVVGGTRFVGKHFVEQALARGHEVTLFHRGRTGRDLFPEADHRIGDRETDLSALATGEWDATVDTCAYLPRHVHELADALGGRGGHHLLVSSVSAYAPPDGPGITEDAALEELDDPTVEEITAETYGGLKVVCERTAVERHGPETLLVRPTYVVGPDDYTWRFPRWVDRVARGGDVAVPGPPDSPIQVIDVRDLGAWMVRLLEDGQRGAFHACSPAPHHSWRQMVDALVEAVGPPGTTVTWIDPAVVTARDLPPSAFPLWSPDDSDIWVMACDPTRAYDSGLTPRPLAETARDTLAWIRASESPGSTGLDDDTESALIATARG
jgi:2'-hydroxyisoflavone reductase